MATTTDAPAPSLTAASTTSGVRLYEAMFLLDTTKFGGDLPAVIEKLHQTMQKHGAEILASRPWNEQRLAYPVKNQKKGLYYLVYFRSPGTAVVEMEGDFRINETILRQLIVYVEPKWEEVMLALARDEHASVALRSGHDEDDPLGGGDRDRDRDGDRGPRRGLRRPPEGEDKD